MASTVEEITINFSEEGGTQVCKEIEKEVLTKGAWATIMFKYQDLDRVKGEFKAPKISIRRYQKRNGEYKTKSKFNISSVAQALKVMDVLKKWTENESSNDVSSDSDD